MNTPTMADVTKRLQRQANGTERADCQRNLADHVWIFIHRGVAPDTGEIWQELLADFEDLNTLLRIAGNELHFSRELVYAVNGLVTLCLSHAAANDCREEVRNHLLQLAWRIGVAWDAVLAGDIESIRDHVRLEEMAHAIEGMG